MDDRVAALIAETERVLLMLDKHKYRSPWYLFHIFAWYVGHKLQGHEIDEGPGEYWEFLPIVLSNVGLDVTQDTLDMLRFAHALVRSDGTLSLPRT